MRLAIISHTEHYITETGKIVGWGPTITEINHLTDLFEEIYHIAMLKDTVAPASALPYTSDAITFVPIPNSGGSTFFSKVDSLMKAPKVISIVADILKKVDVFQLRTPTGIGIYLIPYLTLFVKTPGWYKYAGNWNQKNAPLGYALQRWLLKNQSRTVTINGRWEQQPKNCLTFENPCLTLSEVQNGLELIGHKNVNGLLRFCFVGRLEEEKGVLRIINAFKSLETDYKKRIEQIDFVGIGPRMAFFKDACAEMGLPFEFHGTLPRQEVHDIYKKAHVLLLPTTASEGFPKVIAEAMNFGCIPIVSDISAIGDYVANDVNGFLIHPVTTDNLVMQMKKLFALSPADFINFQRQQRNSVEKFTFGQYHQKLKNDILNRLEF